MKVSTAFDTYQRVVNAPKEEMIEARRRRDLFADAFAGETNTVSPSGSLARGTQHDPIKDVDTILVFEQDDFPDWGQPGQSAQHALDHVHARVKALLGTDGSFAAGEVRLIKPRNHSVKCFLDDPEDDAPFTVDAMPALRQDGGTLLIPESRNDKWVLTNPGLLIDEVLTAHKTGGIFAPMVRVLKRWAKTLPGLNVRSLYMEVLALECLPRTGTRQQALSSFFTAAAVRVNDPVCDPAGLCGEIQPDIDTVALRDHLDEAAEVASNALLHESWDQHNVAVNKWGEIFGSDFPKGDGGGGGSDGGVPGGLGAGAAGTLGGLGAGDSDTLDIPERVPKDIHQG
jgi:hypothetical protein